MKDIDIQTFDYMNCPCGMGAHYDCMIHDVFSAELKELVKKPSKPNESDDPEGGLE